MAPRNSSSSSSSSSISAAVGRWSALVAGLWMLGSGGLSYNFAIYSSQLKVHGAARNMGWAGLGWTGPDLTHSSPLSLSLSLSLASLLRSSSDVVSGVSRLLPSVRGLAGNGQGHRRQRRAAGWIPQLLSAHMGAAPHWSTASVLPTSPS